MKFKINGNIRDWIRAGCAVETVELCCSVGFMRAKVSEDQFEKETVKEVAVFTPTLLPAQKL